MSHLVKYENLLRKPFKLGEQDCYTLVRDFYLQNYDIDLPDYARPTDYWKRDYKLFDTYFKKEGFKILHSGISDWQSGDVVLMGLGADFSTHAAVYIGMNRIIHHPPGRLSGEDFYKGIWRNRTLGVVRHGSQFDREISEETFDLSEHPRFKKLRTRLG